MNPIQVAEFPLWDALRHAEWWQAGLAIFVVAAVLINVVAVFVGISTYVERKAAAHMQSRVGPYRIGPHGFLVWIADAVKLMTKEDIVPRDADQILFRMAPYVVVAGSFACWAALPYGAGWSPAPMDIGILYILAFSSAVVIGILMAGWSSASKWSLFGAMRSAAQIVSYEVPVGLTVLGMLLVYGTLDLQDICRQQAGPGLWGLVKDCGELTFLSWGVFRHPPFTMIAFIVYFIGALAETNRTPFDIPEAESELVAGFHTEYSGMRFSFFTIAENGNMFIVSAIASTLFLGGWQSPVGRIPEGTIPGLLLGMGMFTAKALFLVFVMMWLRWTLPRYRVDQLMDLCWKKLTPLAFVNLFAIGIGEYNRWAGIAVGGAAFAFMAAIIGKELFRPPPQEPMPGLEGPKAA